MPCRNVLCPRRHTVFCTVGGDAFGCGWAEVGQLGDFDSSNAVFRVCPHHPAAALSSVETAEPGNAHVLQTTSGGVALLVSQQHASCFKASVQPVLDAASAFGARSIEAPSVADQRVSKLRCDALDLGGPQGSSKREQDAVLQHADHGFCVTQPMHVLVHGPAAEGAAVLAVCASHWHTVLIMSTPMT